jgi:hypothetical protein
MNNSESHRLLPLVAALIGTLVLIASLAVTSTAAKAALVVAIVTTGATYAVTTARRGG